MLNYNPQQRLPTSEELPCSDDTPVDHELQNTIPNLLRAILLLIWAAREDWFFGVDMGIYDRSRQILQTPIFPDGFLSLRVQRHKKPKGRLSYVLAEENNIVPVFVLEYVSKTYGGEYDRKMEDYARLGVRYYTIYNPDYWQRDQHQPLEVYRLTNGNYERQLGEPVWMPEVGLGIGRELGVCEQWQRDWLYWYDQQLNRYQVPEELIEQLQQQLRQQELRAQQAESQLQQEKKRAQQLAEMLRRLGVDPDSV
ncbi:MAG: Uma2 family endonuclease [Symploca sp. SIO1C4]|uniref:Uma2 family endonuclease n=1 Tax=Symploca sp. SIO1C4 TaxID=2607765 RepID=A0A6B3N9F9_9CYAN|nr:Uma2 family endonuclease [Symploca sp. SIO1C4]